MVDFGHVTHFARVAFLNWSTFHALFTNYKGSFQSETLFFFVFLFKNREVDHGRTTLRYDARTPQNTRRTCNFDYPSYLDHHSVPRINGEIKHHRELNFKRCHRSISPGSCDDICLRKFDVVNVAKWRYSDLRSTPFEFMKIRKFGSLHSCGKSHLFRPE